MNYEDWSRVCWAKERKTGGPDKGKENMRTGQGEEKNEDRTRGRKS